MILIFLKFHLANARFGLEMYFEDQSTNSLEVLVEGVIAPMCIYEISVYYDFSRGAYASFGISELL